MISLNGKQYAFDLKKVMNFINYSDKAESKETEITDAYESDENTSDFKLTNKVVRQLSAPGNQQIDNIKYDLLKMFISLLLTFDDTVEDYDEETLPFGLKLAFNTLIKEGFLIQIK